jgi:putative Ig domain-containing protein
MQFWPIASCAKLRKRMRNIILAVLAGPILFGCLTAEESIATGSIGNSTPTIAGNPAWATKYDEMYEFKPSASDADGDTLAFDVQNKPNWANFDATTGELYGQPTLADVGDYGNIVVSVSDSTNSASLPAFSIAVTETALGTVTLSWVAPTQNSDGSPLMDLAGYRIYYRKNSGSYNQAVRLENPSITSYVVEQLSPATYYFAATAITTTGVESSFSARATTTIQ